MASCPSGITFFLLLSNHGRAGGHVHKLRLTRQHFASKHMTQLQYKASNSVSYICTESRSWKSAKPSKARAVWPWDFTERLVHVILASSKNHRCDLGAKSGMLVSTSSLQTFVQQTPCGSFNVTPGGGSSWILTWKAFGPRQCCSSTCRFGVIKDSEVKSRKSMAMMAENWGTEKLGI